MSESPLLKVSVGLANGRLVQYEASGVECRDLHNGQPYILYLTDRDDAQLASFRPHTEWVRYIVEAPPEAPVPETDRP